MGYLQDRGYWIKGRKLTSKDYSKNDGCVKD
jgi:hypothetical protein